MEWYTHFTDGNLRFNDIASAEVVIYMGIRYVTRIQVFLGFQSTLHDSTSTSRVVSIRDEKGVELKAQKWWGAAGDRVDRFMPCDG